MKRKTTVFVNSRSAWAKGISVAVSAMLVSTLGACGAMQKADQLSGASGASAEKCPVAVNKDVKGTIRIAWQAIANADLIVKDRKMLETCMPNATIQWNQFNSGGDVVQAFGSRSVDLGLAGSSPAVKSVSAPLNLNVKVLWIHDIIGEAESLVTRDSSAKSIKDLAGKNIAVPFGSTSHFSLLSALSQAGMDSSSVHLINLDPDKMAAAWSRGEIDAAWVWDPVLSKLKADKGSMVTSSAVTAKNGAATFDMELVSGDFIKANPSAVKTWTAVENYAVGMIASNPSSAADSISAQLGNSPEEVKTQFKGYSYPNASEQSKIFSDQLPGIFKATAQFLKGQGDLDAVNDDYAPALYTTAIDAVAKQ